VLINNENWESCSKEVPYGYYDSGPYLFSCFEKGTQCFLEPDVFLSSGETWEAPSELDVIERATSNTGEMDVFCYLPHAWLDNGCN
jgi:hypothetical protein